MQVSITDMVIFIFVFWLIWLVYRLKQNKRLFAKFISCPYKLIAPIVLLAYLIIAVLDSCHFKSEHKVISALDYVLSHISYSNEVSYSAPFALNLFSKEVSYQSGGAKLTEVRLNHIPQNVVDSKIRNDDIVKKVIISILQTMLAMLIFCVLIYSISIKNLMKLFSKKWLPVFFCLFILIFITCAVLNLMPSYHILGTDKVGRDVFYLAVKSIRTGLLIGCLTLMLAVPIAVLLGGISGYFKGKIDDIIQYIYITLNSIPSVLLIAAAVLTIQVLVDKYNPTVGQRGEIRLLIICCILGTTSWTGLCRLLRAEILKLREMEFILAARAAGLPNLQIILKHIVPNLTHIILTAIALDFSGLVLAEAVLSYVGVGVDPASYSWGNMINGARMEMAREPVVWWSLVAAFSFMFILVLMANIFADTVRDVLDPKVV